MSIAEKKRHETNVRLRGPVRMARPRPSLSSVPRAHVCNELHPGVYKFAFVCWMCLLAEFILTFFVSASALFVIAVDVFFAIVYFGVPSIMNRMKPQTTKTPGGFSGFLKARFDTLYGPIGGFEALVQVVIVPLALSAGGVAIFFIVLWARATS